MTELRIDALTEEPVVLAPARRGIGAARPAGLPALDARGCPFCPGQEAETEAAHLTIGEPWRVRVVDNRYPLVRPLHLAAPGFHELVIESPAHDADLATYALPHAVELFEALQSRVRTLQARTGVAAVSAFRNRGRRAGSSQPHPHTQVVALGLVPPETARRQAAVERDPQVLERLMAMEKDDGRRWIVADDGWATLCPYASHRAWETRIAPEDGALRRFSDLDPSELRALARAVVDAASRLRRVLGVPDYNVLFRDPPVGHRGVFVVDLLPRTGGDAGFELQSGIDVCVVAPESAASALRDIGERQEPPPDGSEVPDP